MIRVTYDTAQRGHLVKLIGAEEDDAGRLTRLNRIDTTSASGRPRPRLKPRGIPPALASRPVYTTDQPSQAARFGRDLLGPHSIRITGADQMDFQASLHAVLLRDVTLGYLDYGVDTEVLVRQLTEDQLVIVPAVGSCMIEQDGEVAVGSPVRAIVPTSNLPMKLTFDGGSPLVVLRIDRAAFEVHLSRLVGHLLGSALVFDLELDLAVGSASRWNFAVQLLHAELFEETSLLHAGIGVGQLEEFVMSSLLYSHRSNYSEQLIGDASQERRAVRRAVEFVERNLARPITVSDVAAAAGVSLRTLQAFFAEDLQQTPSSFIRNRRLERARADLADAPPGSGATVSQIANRWGFSHLGRFANTYHQRFGEPPSQTLRS